MAQKGLGMGLGALFGDDAIEDNENDFTYLPVSKVEPRPDQPRSVFDEEGLNELAESIREHGIIPVSYTHLDVYKRQVHTLSFTNTSPSCITFFASPPV